MKTLRLPRRRHFYPLESIVRSESDRRQDSLSNLNTLPRARHERGNKGESEFRDNNNEDIAEVNAAYSAWSASLYLLTFERRIADA